nr:c-type cytochrome [Peteryoungia desertarenae]
MAKILLAALAAVACFAVILVWSGLYNVAASRDHLQVTTWMLERVREQSIATQAMGIEAPLLDDDGMVRLGAAHYEAGCVPCHNRPGNAINPIVEGMLPSPPKLTSALEERKPETIYWIVKHGLKYTGMPAWPDQTRDDEVWAVTAFLQTLQRPSDQQYLDLAGVRRISDDVRTEGFASFDRFTECGRCHDSGRLDTNGDRIPRLSGQSPEYLLRSLREYAGQDRPSGVMEPVAALLDEETMRALVARYARVEKSRSVTAPPSDAEQLERGRIIAQRGDPKRGVPACDSCHAAGRSPQFPRLAGQHADYLVGQLELWQRGGRTGTTYGRIMSHVASRLSADQISDVTSYYQSLPGDGAPDGAVARAGP